VGKTEDIDFMDPANGKFIFDIAAAFLAFKCLQLKSSKRYTKYNS